MKRPVTVESVMDNIRRLAKKSGLTHQEIGLAMGYPDKSARASAHQFVTGKNPAVSRLIRFAEAIGVEPKELFE